LLFCDCICEEKLERFIIDQTRIIPAAAQAFPIETSTSHHFDMDNLKLTHQFPSDQCPPKTHSLCAAKDLHPGRRGLGDTGESGRTQSATMQVHQSHFGGHQSMR
jgi:hypothetical protein